MYHELFDHNPSLEEDTCTFLNRLPAVDNNPNIYYTANRYLNWEEQKKTEEKQNKLEEERNKEQDDYNSNTKQENIERTTKKRQKE